MKPKFFKNFELKILVLLFVVINIVLVLAFLKTDKHREQEKNQQASADSNWRNSEYPEIEQIKGSDWDFQKLTAFFKDLAKQKGGEYAYHALAVTAFNGYLAPNVDTHLLGHVVGDELYKQEGVEGIKVCTEDLRNACSHSIVVGMLLDQGPASLSKIVDTCHDAPGGPGAYLMCVHGLGHGVLGYTQYDMRKAVTLCEQIAKNESGSPESAQCIGGVTMEMMSGVHDHIAWQKQLPNYFKKDDPLAPCDIGFIPENALGFCYSYLTPHLFEAAGASLDSPDPKYFGKAMSFCLKLPTKDPNRTQCLGSFGKEYTVLANARNVQSIVSMSDDQLKNVYNWCGLGPKEGLSPCLSTALASLYWGGENNVSVSVRFCSLMPDKSQSTKCVNLLIDNVHYYKKDSLNARKDFCQQLPAEYVTTCNSKEAI